jgi:hypothetical protein
VAFSFRSSSPKNLRSFLAGLGLIAIVPMRAAADSSDSVAAEALFRRGKSLLAQKDYGRACFKFVESFRADPASGTLLALAMCHEREGSLASAWKDYADAAERSKVEGRAEREKAALAKMTELEPRLSKLTIGLSPECDEVPSIDVTRNGTPVRAVDFGTAMTVDGGMQIIEASAPGKRAWHAHIFVAGEGDERMVTVPRLEDAEPEKLAFEDSRTDPAVEGREDPEPLAPQLVVAERVDGVRAEAAPGLADREIDSSRGLAPLQRIGLAVGGAGLVGVGAGAFFAFRAVSQNNDSKTGCTADRCMPPAKQDRLDARESGELATIGMICGGALTAAGVTLYILGRSPDRASKQSSLEALPIAGPGVAGGMLQGTFP